MTRTQNPVLRAAEHVGSQAALARLLGVTPSMVYQWIAGKRPVTAEQCPAIERATDGQVRCEDLRPDVAWGVLRRATTRVKAGA